MRGPARPLALPLLAITSLLAPPGRADESYAGSLLRVTGRGGYSTTTPTGSFGSLDNDYYTLSYAVPQVIGKLTPGPSGSSLLVLEPPIPVSMTLTRKYDNYTSPPGPVTVTMKAQIRDDFGSTRIYAQGETTGVIPASSSGTLTLSLSGFVDVIALYGTFGTISIDLDLYGKVDYEVTFLKDATSFSNPSPPYAETLEGGKTYDFAADVKYRVGTRDTGLLALRLLDQDGNLQGSSDFLTVGKGDGERTVSMRIPKVEVPYSATKLKLKSVLWDAGQTRALAEYEDGRGYAVSGCTLHGLVRRVTDARTYWLPWAPIELWDASASPEVKLASSTVELKGTPDFPRSEYCFKLTTPLDPKKRYRVKVRAQDAAAETSARFLVSPTPDQTASGTELRWPPFTTSSIQGGTLDLNVNAFDLDVPLDWRENPLPMETALAAAETYWWMWQMVHRVYAENVAGIPLSRDLPVEVYLHDTSGDTHYCPTAQGSCPSASSIALARADSVPGANPSVVFHEFGHHVIRELYGGEIPRPASSTDPLKDRNHNGFYNDYSSSSIDEGFASFWAAATSRLLEPEVQSVERGMFRWNTPTPQNSSPIFIEENNTPSQPLVGEELAIGGILWDLLDARAETEPLGSLTLRDDAAVALPELLGVFSTSRPRSLLALSSALAARFPDLAAKGSDGLSRLDHVFLLHRAFFDRNGNGVWDRDASPPEEIGRAANGWPWQGQMTNASGQVVNVTVPARPGRENLPQRAGSLIDVALKGENGEPVADATVRVELKHGTGYESHDASFTLPLKAGQLYFEMPPPHYPAVATLSVPGSPGPVLTIDNAWYWANVTGTGPGSFAAETFVVPILPEITSLDRTSGPVGAAVTLRGKRFGSALADVRVAFGSVAGEVLSLSDTEIATRVPEGLGAGNTSLTAAVAGKTSLPVSFRVTAGVLSAAPTSLDFGSVEAGKPADRTVTLANTGTAPLTVLAAGADSPSFAKVSPATPFIIEPGAQRSLTVRFAPGRAGTYAATLRISSEDRSRRTASVALSGTATAVAGPIAEVLPGAVDFGPLAVGSARTVTVSLRNTGTTALTVSSTTSTSAGFSLSAPALPLTVASGGSTALTLRFAPATAGASAGVVTLATNASGSPSLGIPVKGEGTASTPATPCTTTLSRASVWQGAAGGDTTLEVTAPAGCAWSASSPASFVTITSGASGSANGSVVLRFAPNQGPSRAGTVTVAGLPVAVSQDAGLGEGRSLVPIVLTVEGLQGATFTSELSVTNRGAADALLEVVYTAAFGGGSGSGWDVVPAGGQLVLPDAMSYLRSLGIPVPASGNRGGTLRLRAVGVSSASSVAATVRTSSVVPEGRAGLAYGSVPPQEALTGTAWIPGLRQNATDRSNVALVHAGGATEGDLTLRLTIISGDSSERATQDVFLSPGGFSQVSGVLASNGLSLTNGYVKVERIAGTAPYTAYGVINDMANSDGSFVPPVAEGAYTGRTGLTLPVVVEVSSFSTELVAANVTPVPRRLRLTYVAEALTTPDKTATLSLDLPAGGQLILPDFVQYLRSRGVAGIAPVGTTHAGALFAEVEGGGDVTGLFVGSRTSSPGGGGRYGVFTPAVARGASAKTSAWLLGLRQDAANRTNVALVNTGEASAATDGFRLDLYDGATGRLARTVDGVSLAPRKWTQLTTILASYAPGVTSGYAKVTRTSGDNPFLAYAVVNDGGQPGQRSGDGAYVPMSAVDETP